MREITFRKRLEEFLEDSAKLEELKIEATRSGSWSQVMEMQVERIRRLQALATSQTKDFVKVCRELYKILPTEAFRYNLSLEIDHSDASSIVSDRSLDVCFDMDFVSRMGEDGEVSADDYDMLLFNAMEYGLHIAPLFVYFHAYLQDKLKDITEGTAETSTIYQWGDRGIYITHCPLQGEGYNFETTPGGDLILPNPDYGIQKHFPISNRNISGRTSAAQEYYEQCPELFKFLILGNDDQAEFICGRVISQLFPGSVGYIKIDDNARIEGVEYSNSAWQDPKHLHSYGMVYQFQPTTSLQSVINEDGNRLLQAIRKHKKNIKGEPKKQLRDLEKRIVRAMLCSKAAVLEE